MAPGEASGWYTRSRLSPLADTDTDTDTATATVEVQTSTRDLLLQLSASRRQSADQVILGALTAMQRDERRLAAAEVW